MKKIILGLTALMISLTAFGEITGNGETYAELEFGNTKQEVLVDFKTDRAGFNAVFFDGGLTFGDSGFSVDAFVSRQFETTQAKEPVELDKNKGNAVKFELYPKYTFVGMDNYSPYVQLRYLAAGESSSPLNNDSNPDKATYGVKFGVDGKFTDQFGFGAYVLYDAHLFHKVGTTSSKKDHVAIRVTPKFAFNDALRAELRLQYGMKKDFSGDNAGNKFVVRPKVDYKINDQTKVYAYLAYENESGYDDKYGIDNTTVIKPGIGASYALFDNLSLNGEFNYGMETIKYENNNIKDEKTNTAYIKLGVGYNIGQ